MPKLFPDDDVKSTYDVDFRALYREGYRALLFDVDNTLVPHDAPADERAKALFSMLNEIGFKCMFISNNSEPRVKTFCEAVGAFGYIYKAKKPMPGAYEEGMRRMLSDRSTTLFFGDQLFTDIWGANNACVRSILVKPIHKFREPGQIILKRLLEAPILLSYRMLCSNKRKKWRVPLQDGRVVF
ncbi:MAG: HAD-IIIA family hydrolase [Lachnospiraceae bacterium]|nr:HAD-IIIA family hydrolase [Lachnospiraceae bacterium]MBQ6258726.1 HAD-IIIA family hydrolase [Lachnospiraceae bacterium]